MAEKLRKGEEGAKWVSVPCWHNCGSRCLLKALVRDGEVLRMKTDDTVEDTWEHPQNRSCPMGHALYHQVFDEGRLKYPMKRKHYTPEDPHRELRGVDEWERISWDEALDYFAAALKKAKAESGNDSIVYMNLVNMEGRLGPVLSAFGGYTDTTGTTSYGSFYLANAQFGWGVMGGTLNDRMDLENSDYIVFFGHNAAWSAFGNPSYYLKHAKEAGCKFVYVGPEYSETAGFTNALWVPVRPGTDTALLLGVAYAMIERDEGGSLIDWDFLNRCTVGFDADHMPADATTDENFRGYVLGEYDGTPKTPEWASEICGTPIERIYEFAEIAGCKNNVSFHSNGAPARCKGAENYPQLLMTVAAMGGHIGKPGNCAGDDQSAGAMNGGMMAFMPLGGQYKFTTAGNPVDKTLTFDLMWDAILDGEYWDAGNNMAAFLDPAHPMGPRKGQYRTLDAKVLVSEGHNCLATMPNTNKGIDAFRKVDFVWCSAYYMKLDAQFADVVVPITTRWENEQDCFMLSQKDKENVFAWRAPIAARGESRSDYDVAQALSERLGIDYSEVNPFSDTQEWFNQISNSVVFGLGEGGAPMPVAAVDEADLERYGVQGMPHPGLVPFEKLLDDGVFRMQRAAGDPFTYIPFAEFRQDPEANPLQTTVSGKLEIYCQAKSDWFDMVNGYADGGEGACEFVRVSPLPKFLEAACGYKETFSDWESKAKGDYPFQLTHTHYLRRAHTDCDNIGVLREALVNPVWINDEDARVRGIKTGDTIRVFSAAGEFLRPASVTRTVMPGVVLIPHGATARFDKETGMEIAGADNMLTSAGRTSTPFLDSWNSTLVNYEKYDGPIELLPDCEMPQMVPLAED